MFEDYSRGQHNEEAFAEAIEIIMEARALSRKTPHDIEEAKKTGLSKKELSLLKKENEEIKIALFVMEELDKYNTPEGMAELYEARMLTANGPESFMTAILPTKKEIKSYPSQTQTQINRRRNALMRAENIETAKRTFEKYYKNGIEVYDTALLDELYETENGIQLQILEITGKIKAAKESGLKDDLPLLKQKFKRLRLEKSDVQRLIKAEEHRYSLYCRAVKPYIEAQRVINQAESYARLDELEDEYIRSKES
jgi:hypothetical protein